MLTVIQFPYSDVRTFLQEPTQRLDVPAWDALDPTRDFVRSIGSIRKRYRGHTAEWPEEKAFCRVSRAIRFEPSYRIVSEPELAPLVLRRYCAFRRFIADGIFKDGSVVARLEFGFGMRSRAKKFPTPRECITYVRSILDMPVLFHGSGDPRRIRLIETRDLFAGLYLQSTTKRTTGQSPAVQPWWFRAGLPLAVVEFPLIGAMSGLPPLAKVVPGLAYAGITLAYVGMEMSRLSVGTWLIGVEPGTYDAEILRQLRVSLLRIHAERQSMTEILRLLRRDKITVARDTQPTNNLQLYLSKSVKFLKSKVRDGLPQSEILITSLEAEDFVQPGERDAMLGKLEQVRGNLLHNLETYLENNHTKALPHMSRNKVFISYSHKDKKFLDELLIHLKTLERQELVSKWSDKQLQPGSQWFSDISRALDETKVAVMLVTKDFLASDFIYEHELGPLLKRASQEGVLILWVLVRDCNWKKTPLKNLQSAYPTEKPLANMKAERDAAWVAICEKIEAACVVR